jgi:hypothetical protein
MKNLLFDALTRAIDGHRLLRITDDAGARVIEPYLIFESAKGDMVLHGWQRSGAFRKTPPPRWCNLHVEDIFTIDVLPERFSKPHRDYNPHSTNFHRVIYAVDERGPREVSAPHAPELRVAPRRKRRGPPRASMTAPERSRGRG